ncbi:MAG: hypothetical protein HY816_11055 [Candidatus Wallbacteria bacterium]|nr:hypothetical protein [Candidatus Wallbacteria bacterium]
MQPVTALCARELKAAARSPGTWLVLAGFQALTGLLFLLILSNTGSTVLAALYYDVGVLFLFMAPMLTASSFGAEWRDGTMELLLTSSLAPRHIVAAKFAGALGVLWAAALSALQYPFWASLFGRIDSGASAAGLAGCLLLASTLAAIGTFAAAATRSTAAAAVLGFAASMFFWFLHSLGLLLGGAAGGAADRFSLYLRFSPFTRGMFDTADAAFFVLMTAAFLALAATGLEAVRSARS